MPIRVLFIGTPQFAVPSLQFLVHDPRFEVVRVVTRPDMPAGRGLRVASPPVKVAAQAMGLAVLQPLSLRSPEAQATIHALAPDVIAVAAYGQWIPSEVFDFPPKKSLNLHPSLLPRHRGAAPVPSTLLAGDREAGLSVLFVEDEMDAGDLLGQLSISIRDDDTTGSFMATLAELGAPFLADTLAGWVAGEIVPQAQDHDQATWIDRMEKSAGHIDWSLPASQLVRWCRAFSPWPGTYTLFDGRRLLVHWATSLPAPCEAVPDAKPGTVVRVGRDVTVVTGDGLLGLDRVQLEGRRPLDIHDFVRGQRSFVGTELG